MRYFSIWQASKKAIATAGKIERRKRDQYLVWKEKVTFLYFLSMDFITKTVEKKLSENNQKQYSVEKKESAVKFSACE